MADLEKDHLDAALNLLRADANLTVYPDANGFVPEPLLPPYVRVYMAIEMPDLGAANRLEGDSVTWVARYYCHCVGGNEYAATAVASQVRQSLLNVVPVIGGRTCGKFRREASVPADRSESAGVPIYDRVDVYRLQTGPG